MIYASRVLRDEGGARIERDVQQKLFSRGLHLQPFLDIGFSRLQGTVRKP